MPSFNADLFRSVWLGMRHERHHVLSHMPDATSQAGGSLRRSSSPIWAFIQPHSRFPHSSGTHTDHKDPFRVLALGLKLGYELRRVGVRKVQAGAGTPVAQEASLDVVELKGPLEERIGAEEDLGRRAGVSHYVGASEGVETSGKRALSLPGKRAINLPGIRLGRGQGRRPDGQCLASKGAVMSSSMTSTAPLRLRRRRSARRRHRPTLPSSLTHARGCRLTGS